MSPKKLVSETLVLLSAFKNSYNFSTIVLGQSIEIDFIHLSSVSLTI